MPKQTGQIGRIRRELEGKACPSCGWIKYQLVLRCDAGPGKCSLFARCSRCNLQWDCEQDSFEAMPIG